MKGPRKKPFTISHSPFKKKIESETSSDNSAKKPSKKESTVIQVKKDPHIELQNQILMKKTAFKNCYNMFQVTPNLLPELLQKYASDNVKYREEGFTQQADKFLMKIAFQKRIPKEVRTNFPLYDILVSICKIYMLNEYEILVLACILDHCNWKIEETVLKEETKFLKEFPGNFDEELSSECKRLIIYLLVITFSLKQYLNEKGVADKIHAYCESICSNFQTFFNRWTRLTAYQKFGYSPVEINRKFRDFTEYETIEQPNTVSDYNIVADSIMELSGSAKSKLEQQKAVVAPYVPVKSLFQSIKPVTSIYFPPIPDQRPIFANLSLNMPLPILSLEKSASKTKTVELNIEDYEIPEVEPLSRRSSSSNLFGDFGRKKLKTESLGFTSLVRDSSLLKEFHNTIGNSMPKTNEIEDFFANIPLPSLSSKKNSNASQAIEEQPSLFRFHSNLSSSWNKDTF